jgi:hypothetical protein
MQPKGFGQGFCYDKCTHIKQNIPMSKNTKGIVPKKPLQRLQLKKPGNFEPHPPKEGGVGSDSPKTPPPGDKKAPYNYEKLG